MKLSGEALGADMFLPGENVTQSCVDLGCREVVNGAKESMQQFRKPGRRLSPDPGGKGLHQAGQAMGTGPGF